MALGAGRADASALLVLSLMRKAFVPLFLLGSVSVVLTGDLGGDPLEGVDTPGEYVRALLSPLAGLILAIFVRLAVGVLGFALAYPLSHRSPLVVDAHPPGASGMVGRWVDRMHLTRALRALRWTRAVRGAAADRVGRWGGYALVAYRVLGWTIPVLLVALVVATAVTT